MIIKKLSKIPLKFSGFLYIKLSMAYISFFLLHLLPNGISMKLGEDDFIIIKIH